MVSCSVEDFFSSVCFSLRWRPAPKGRSALLKNQVHAIRTVL
jgi:hypothetical protein